MADHGVPAHRPIEPGQGRDRPRGARRVKFKTAIAPRYEHAVNPRRLESRHQLRWQSPILFDIGSEPRDHRRERGDARKHLIQCGLVGSLDLGDRRPLLVEKRCHRGILHAGRSSLDLANYGSISAQRECVSNVTGRIDLVRAKRRQARLRAPSGHSQDKRRSVGIFLKKYYPSFILLANVDPVIFYEFACALCSNG